MAKLSLQATIKIVPKTGHNIHIENQNKFVTILQDFYYSTDN
jgi:2-succinyl-6-hydroxy-2,4-cyclohexadiene-1-carboxylate synthase